MLIRQKAAFTLAEVLITLGIIGVVAALTIPGLVVKYQKHNNLVRLKQAYALLSNAFKMAEVDYGDKKNWDVDITGIENSFESSAKASSDFATKYMIPYFKSVKSFKSTSLQEAGYDTYLAMNGASNTHLIASPERKFSIIELPNGTTFFVGTMSSGRYPDGKFYLTYITIYVDVNGKAKPNVWGKDAFMMQFMPDSGFGMFSDAKGSNFVKSDCLDITMNRTCGAYIFENNWEYPEDYPW